MRHIDFFKLQAKNLFKDFKSKSQKYFPDDAEYLVLCEYGYDEDNFSLMKAQHIIALMAGFSKWADLLKASESDLELAKLLFDNRDKVDIEEWKMHLASLEAFNKTTFNSEEKLITLKYLLKGDLTKQEELLFQFEELSTKEKIEYMKKQGSFNNNKEIECLHCGKRFPSNEVKVVRDKAMVMPDHPQTVTSVCKYFPDCDGQMWDLIPIEAT